MLTQDHSNTDCNTKQNNIHRTWRSILNKIREKREFHTPRDQHEQDYKNRSLLNKSRRTADIHRILMKNLM